MTAVYRILFPIFEFCFRVGHPVFRVKGRERIPEGGVMFCCNHSFNSDPFWAIFAVHGKKMMRIMAKIELFRIPVFGPFISALGVFGVDRGKNDIKAIKTALSILKTEEKLLIFPEGKRVDPANREPAKEGVALLATKSNCLVQPMYIRPVRKFWSPIEVVFGQPYRMEYEGPKATAADLRRLTDELMDRVYALEEEL